MPVIFASSLMNTPSQPRLEAAIRAELAPVLRMSGFAGSGRTFRRTKERCIDVVNIQGSRYGGKFTINLAVQPLSIPDVTGKAPDPRRITEAYCEFRRRLGDRDIWWEHDETEVSMRNAVRAATVAYEQCGASDLFEQFTRQLSNATADALASGSLDLAGFGSTKVRLALALSRLRAAEGATAEARAFAQYGLAIVGAAVLLRKQLEELAAA